MIHIPSEGLIQVKVQYERLPHFYYFYGRIEHRYPQCEPKKAAFPMQQSFQGMIVLTNQLLVPLKEANLLLLLKNFYLLFFYSDHYLWTIPHAKSR